MEYKEEKKICQNCKNDFIIEPEDFRFYEKIKVPPPTFCPECRMIRRMVWRNERTLYHNECASSGKPIVSMFNPETGLTVYDRDIWWGDKWNPLDYGQEYDFSKPFFQQFKELLQRTPLSSTGNRNMVNSKYCNHAMDLKNCYLVYASGVGENISYAQGIWQVKDSLDLYTVLKSEQCYDDSLCAGLFQTHFSFNSDDSINCAFIDHCINLQDCLGCINLRHKRYCIFNKQYTKEEYEKERAKYDFGSYKALIDFRKKFDDFSKKFPRKYANNLKCVSVTGDNVLTSKNSKMVFDIYAELENCKYAIHALTMKDSYDGYGIGDNAELLYEGVDVGHNAMNLRFSVLNHASQDCDYTYMCYSSSNLFGCVSLLSQEYCILNKKYSKKEYEELLPRIKKHMDEMPYVDKQGRVYKYGEFFPTEISPFGYNETIAQEYFPITENEATERGFSWVSKKERDYHIDLNANDLPDHIKDVNSDIVGKVISCLHFKTDDHSFGCEAACTEAFRITENEFNFYKKLNLALPRICPNCRHYARLRQRNPLKLWHRKCMKKGCSNEFETSYAPDRPEIVYCESCYQKEVY